MPLLGKIGALWSDNEAYALGSVNARETSRLLEGIERGTVVSQPASEEMKRILTEQREGRLRLPHYLPWPDYFVAHKTGDGPPVIANDVGIIYANGLSGNDRITLPPQLNILAVLNGGSGNDELRSGRGQNILLGGAGNEPCQGLERSRHEKRDDGEDRAA